MTSRERVSIGPEPTAAIEDMAQVAAPFPKTTTPYAWYVAGMLAFAYLLSIMDRYLLSVVLDEVKLSLQLSETQLGLLQGPGFVLLFAVTSIPLGLLADAKNRRNLVVAGLLCWSVATVACGMADTFWELMIARLAVGLGEAALMPCAMSLIASYFSPDKMNRGYAVYTMGASFGRATAFAGGGAVFTWLVVAGGLNMGVLGHFAPWQAVFIIAGVFGIFVSLLFFMTVREPARPVRSDGKKSLAAGFVHVWKYRWAYAAIFIPFSVVNATTSNLGAWSVSFYTRNYGVDVGTASTVIGITGLIVGPLGALAGGWLNDTLYSRGFRYTQPLVMTGISALALVFVGIFAFGGSFTVSAIGYALAYFTVTSGGPTAFGAIQLPTPDHLRGIVSSIFLIVFMTLGSGLGPLIVGVMGDYVFQSPLMLGPSIFVATLVVVAIAVPIGYFGQKKFAAAALAQQGV